MSAPQTPVGRPGRYQRSTGGLVAAMVVLVLAVAGYALVRGVLRDNPDAPPPEQIDYQSVITPASDATGWPVSYPRTLPGGWVATSVNWDGPPTARWHLGLLTGAQEYVALEESPSSPAAMVRQYVDGEARRVGQVSLPGLADTTWTHWEGSDGDTGLVAEVGDRTLLLVSSAGLPPLRQLSPRLALD